MRIERVSNNQFTIFLTFDDLIDRGFTKEDLWYNASSVRSLFSDMMYEASSELGFELEGLLLVQVYLMQAQGMHVVVTQKGKNTNRNDDYVEMKVTLDESKELIFSFDDIEAIIQVAPNLMVLGVKGGQIYHYKNNYYMIIYEEDLPHNKREDVIAVMSEFSSPSIETSYQLKEYGHTIMATNAAEQIVSVFH